MKTIKQLFILLLIITSTTLYGQTFPGGIKPQSTIEAVKSIIPIESYPYNYYLEGNGWANAKTNVKLGEVYYSVSFEFNDKKLIKMKLEFDQKDYNKVIESLTKKYTSSIWTKSDAKCFRAKDILILVSGRYIVCYYEPKLDF